MQSDCSGRSMERCSIYPVPGPFQSMSVVFRRHITFQKLSMCERSRATAQGVFTLCCFIVDHVKNWRTCVQSSKIRFCFKLCYCSICFLWYWMDKTRCWIISFLYWIPLKFLPCSYYQESPSMYINTLNISSYIKATKKFNLSANECTYSSNTP